MLDINFIRKNPEQIQQNNKIRKCKIDVQEILKLDADRRNLITEIDAKRAELNKKSKNKPAPEEIQGLKKLGEDIKKEEENLQEKETKLNALLIQLPNLTHESVPTGKDESGNIEIKTWGGKMEFDFKPKEHWELGEALDLIDAERGAKVSGSRFWYLKGDLVMLEFALIQHASRHMLSKDFTPMLPPMLVREHAMLGTGFFPADKNEIYKVNEGEEELYLIGTSEVPLASYHADEIVDVASSPLKYFGFSSCFRREAGTYGKDMKGIIRGHQFDKIEMFVFCNEYDSWKWHDKMLEIGEEFWQSLEIPYHVLNMCSGDIGAPNAKKYDIEGWAPGQNQYREIASCSNDTDFQARRLNIKYVDQEGNKKLVHTLNNTVCAIGRAIVMIMENHQQKDGSIKIPEILQPYMAGQKNYPEKMIEKLRTWIEIDQKALLGNVESFLQLIPQKTIFMAVVKSNAYGHGLRETAQIISSIKKHEIWFGVDSITEALALRKDGIKNKILVLGFTLPSRLAEATRKKICVTVSSFDLLSHFLARSKNPDFFLKLDSGMHRQGFLPEEKNNLASIFKKHNLKPLGIYTHFASPTNPRHDDFTQKQFKDFILVVDFLEKSGFIGLIKSVSSSGGALFWPEASLDMIRIGIGLYGYPPSFDRKIKINLNPVLSWKTRVSEIKEVPARSPVGYGLTVKVKNKTKLAILPVGYWHGYDRRLSNCGIILLNGQRAKVLGRVSMDMIVADVSKNDKIKVGDEAVLLGRQGPSQIWAGEVCRKMLTGYHYEFLTRLNPLIKRFIV